MAKKKNRSTNQNNPQKANAIEDRPLLVSRQAQSEFNGITICELTLRRKLELENTCLDIKEQSYDI